MLKEHKPLNEQNLEELHDTLLTAVEDAVMEMAELQQQQAGTSEHYSGDAGDQLFCARSISCSTNSLIAAANEMARRANLVSHKALRRLYPLGR